MCDFGSCGSLSLQRSQDVSPLEEARSRLGLTLCEIAAMLGCSEAAVSRYLSGSRTPPPALYLILGSPALAREHDAWLIATGRKRKRGEVELTIVTRLPRGMSEAQAREKCLAALGEIAEGAER